MGSKKSEKLPCPKDNPATSSSPPGAFSAKLSTCKALPLSLSVLVCGTIAFLVTYPLGMHLDGLLVYVLDHGKIFYGDALDFINYLASARNAIAEGHSLWEIAVSNPDFAMPPTYLFSGAVLTLIVFPLVAHNLFFMFSVFLAALVTFCLIKELTNDRVASVYGAVLFASSNYLVHHLIDGHGNQIQIFWIAGLLLTIERFFRTGKWQNALVLGVVFGFLVLSSAQYALYSAILMPLFMVFRRPEGFGMKRLMGLSFIAFAGVLGVAGYYIWLKSNLDSKIYPESYNLVFSLHHLKDLINPNHEVHIGMVPIILTVLACRIALREKVKWVWAYVFLGIMGVLLMKGPFHPYAPYAILYRYLPFVDHVRTPLRFIPFVLLSTSVLAGYSVSYVRQKTTGSWKVLVVIAVFLITLFSHHLRSERYYRRSPRQGAVWVVDFNFKTQGKRGITSN